MPGADPATPIAVPPKKGIFDGVFDDEDDVLSPELAHTKAAQDAARLKKQREEVGCTRADDLFSFFIHNCQLVKHFGCIMMFFSVVASSSSSSSVNISGCCTSFSTGGASVLHRARALQAG